MALRHVLPGLLIMFGVQSCQKEAGCPDASLKRKNRNAVCQAFLAPVCGCDGRTYGNECEARREGIRVAYSGECTPATPE